MSFESNLAAGGTLYIIPRGCTSAEKVIKVVNSRANTYIGVHFPQEDYQVITDESLRDRGMDLQKYLEMTESWRKRA